MTQLTCCLVWCTSLSNSLHADFLDPHHSTYQGCVPDVIPVSGFSVSCLHHGPLVCHEPSVGLFKRFSFRRSSCVGALHCISIIALVLLSSSCPCVGALHLLVGSFALLGTVHFICTRVVLDSSGSLLLLLLWCAILKRILGTTLF